MSADSQPWTIVGQGLAGTCLAWELWKRGARFKIVDREAGGSSRVAAGMINPITGKNFEPSAHIAGFLPQAMAFYAAVEKETGSRIWHPFPVLRMAATAKEWRKILSKTKLPDVARWLADGGTPAAVDGWAGAIEVQGGGRLDTRSYLDGSREFFRNRGLYQKAAITADSATNRHIWCDGAAGLITGRHGPHRCAKGEILTIRASAWDESRIRIGAGGWLVPIGEGAFKCGSTYEWDELDELPTANGRMRVTEIATRLGGPDFEILHHEAGIRPILRRSEPLIGRMETGAWMFNGLGSKGSLYAPGIAKQLAACLLDGLPPDAEFDIRHFRNTQS